MFLIAHRANDNHKFSENSKNAIISCLNYDYIDGVEIDVRITKDKKLVLMHNPIIDFDSDGSGIVKYMTMEELKKYKYGKSRETITTLEEVFEIIGNKILLIELKANGNDYITMVDKTVRLINKYARLNIYVCSFNFGLLTYLKNNYNNIKCGLIIGYGMNKLKYINNFDFLVLSHKKLALLNKKNYNFVFGIKNSEVPKLPEEIYLISDESYKLSKLKNNVRILANEVNYGK